MNGNPAEAVIAAIEEHLDGWRPDGGMSLYETLTTLPGVFEALHNALQGILDGVSDEQDLPGWFTEAGSELLKSVTAAQEQAATMDEAFQKAYAFFIDDRRKRTGGRRRR